MINIQETINDDGNARKRDEPNDDIVKQTENMRRRIQDYWSRATSLLSTSRETTTSPDENSTSSDDSTERTPFSNFRFMPPPYVTNDLDKKDIDSVTVFDSPTNNVTKENKDVLDRPIFEKLDGETNIATPRTMKKKWWRKGGSLPHAKLHPSECLVINPTSVEEPKGNARGSYRPDLMVNPPMGRVHPKLPDYDEIRSRFTTHRARS